jgi:hypothetical protein
MINLYSLTKVVKYFSDSLLVISRYSSADQKKFRQLLCPFMSKLLAKKTKQNAKRLAFFLKAAVILSILTCPAETVMLVIWFGHH